MCFQCTSNGHPVVFKCVPIMQINTGLPLGQPWVLTPAGVVPVASQCTCCSSGVPLCSNYANNEAWKTTGIPLCDSISQCVSSVVCPVVSQCTESVLFGGHIRSSYFPACNPLCMQLEWRVLFELSWFHLYCNPKQTKTTTVFISKACTE